MNQQMTILVVVLLLLGTVVGCENESTTTPDQRYSEISERNFAVGDSPALTIDNFVGAVRVRPGDAGVVQIVATKRAKREGDLGQIEVEMTEVQGGVRITTDNPSELDDVSVDLEIAAPPDTRPIIQNGVGNIDYEGRAEGRCHFWSGVGSIGLTLPAGVNVELNLAVGVGSIYLEFSVDGQVSQRVVKGTIGTGADGEIYAQAGVGNINVIRQ